MTNDRKIFGAMILTGAAVVFAKRDIQIPMQATFGCALACRLWQCKNQPLTTRPKSAILYNVPGDERISTGILNRSKRAAARTRYTKPQFRNKRQRLPTSRCLTLTGSSRPSREACGPGQGVIQQGTCMGGTPCSPVMNTHGYRSAQPACWRRVRGI